MAVICRREGREEDGEEAEVGICIARYQIVSHNTHITSHTPHTKRLKILSLTQCTSHVTRLAPHASSPSYLVSAILLGQLGVIFQQAERLRGVPRPRPRPRPRRRPQLRTHTTSVHGARGLVRDEGLGYVALA